MKIIFSEIEDDNLTQIANEAQSHCNSFAKKFNVEIVNDGEGLATPYDDLLKWNSTLWVLTIKRLTEAVQGAIK